MIASSRKNMGLYQTFALVLLAGVSAANFMEPGMREYCQWEFFNATCPDGALVVMTAARYGRMRLGRCIDTEFQIGCSADVLTFIDSRCSGRPKCVISLPDNSLHHQQPCNKDMMAYLEASYTCVTVSDADPKSCTETSSIQLHDEEGYLSSYTAQEHGHGAASCPWVITVKSGQKIRLTLMDFSIATRYKSDTILSVSVAPPPGSQKVLSEHCHLYATVSEHNRSKRQTICAENTREYVAYTSTSNSVSIELSEHILTDPSVSFFIKYSVTGCADFEAPKSSWTERSGDRVTVRCNHTSQSWHMICKGVVWIGQTSECQEDYPVGEKVVDESQFPTYGLVIAVIIGVFVGSFCGFLLLAIVLWCKRQTLPRYDPEVELVASSGDSDHVCKIHRLPTGEYGYTHVWEVRNTQLPMPLGGGPGGPGGGGSSLHRTQDSSAYETSIGGGQSVIADHPPTGVRSVGGGIHGVRKEHVYECPIFDERFLLQRLQHHYPHHCPHDPITGGRTPLHCQQHGPQGRGFPSPPVQQQGQGQGPTPPTAATDQTRSGLASPTDRVPSGGVGIEPRSTGSLLTEDVDEDDKLRPNFTAKIHGYTPVFTAGGEQDQHGGGKPAKATENHYL